MSFQQLGLKPLILSAIERLGFQQPTEIQQKAIPVLLENQRDFIGLAQTGTGKTAAFGLPIIQHIDSSSRSIQSIIVCPTRELCVQIAKELKLFAADLSGVSIVAVYGGVAITNQIRDLKRGAHIVVGTPGRLLDHISRGTLVLNRARMLVLDEADEMFNMGFQKDIESIFSYLPADRRTWLFSATMSDDVERVARRHMTDPVKVMVGGQNSSARNLDHYYCTVRRQDQFEALRRYVDYYPDMFGIVFCRTKMDARALAHDLANAGYNVDALHGDLSQYQRDAVMKKFRSKLITVLVATDVAARGIDVSDVTHVIHYGLPEDAANYTHRSGRTARAGKSGMSIAIVTGREASRISYISRVIGVKIAHLPVPTGSMICERKIAQFAQSMKGASESTEQLVRSYIPTVLAQFEGVSKEDLVARLVGAACGALIKSYEHAVDINADVRTEGRSDSGRSEGGRSSYGRGGGGRRGGGSSSSRGGYGRDREQTGGGRRDRRHHGGGGGGGNGRTSAWRG